MCNIFTSKSPFSTPLPVPSNHVHSGQTDKITNNPLALSKAGLYCCFIVMLCCIKMSQIYRSTSSQWSIRKHSNGLQSFAFNVFCLCHSSLVSLEYWNGKPFFFKSFRFCCCLFCCLFLSILFARTDSFDSNFLLSLGHD